MLGLAQLAASSEVQEVTSAEEGQNIKVIVRLRNNDEDASLPGGVTPEPLPCAPGPPFARTSSCKSVVLSEGGSGSVAQQLAFDYVASPSMQQNALFKVAGRPLVTSLLEGINGALLAYGQTSSGKTYTMFGPSSAKSPQELKAVWPHAGIVPRAIKNLFARLPPKFAPVATPFQRNPRTPAAFLGVGVTPHRNGRALEPSWLVKLSVIEIYQEVVSDLLADPAPAMSLSSSSSNEQKTAAAAAWAAHCSQRLQVREDIARGVYVEGLSEHIVDNADEAMELVDKAQRARHVAATRLNRRSSRSHALVLLSLEQRIPVVPSAPTPRALDTPAAFATAAPKPARPFGAGLRGPPAGAMSPVASLSFCAGPQQHAGDDGPATPDMFKLGGAKPANHQGLDMFGTPPAFGPMGLATPGPAHGSSKSVAWGGAGTCAARGQQQRTVLPTCTRILRSKLYLVDLAGSERQVADASDAERMKEASAINRSLSTLSLVILKLTEAGAHVPYRNSKLTMLLQCALGGNSCTTLIATINTSATHKAETVSTLNFAMRAKSVTVTAFVNEERQEDTAALTLELQRLRSELAALRAAQGAGLGSLATADSKQLKDQEQLKRQPDADAQQQQQQQQQQRLRELARANAELEAATTALELQVRQLSEERDMHQHRAATAACDLEVALAKLAAESESREGECEAKAAAEQRVGQLEAQVLAKVTQARSFRRLTSRLLEERVQMRASLRAQLCSGAGHGGGAAGSLAAGADADSLLEAVAAFEACGDEASCSGVAAHQKDAGSCSQAGSVCASSGGRDAASPCSREEGGVVGSAHPAVLGEVQHNTLLAAAGQPVAGKPFGALGSSQAPQKGAAGQQGMVGVPSGASSAGKENGVPGGGAGSTQPQAARPAWAGLASSGRGLGAQEQQQQQQQGGLGTEHGAAGGAEAPRQPVLLLHKVFSGSEQAAPSYRQLLSRSEVGGKASRALALQQSREQQAAAARAAAAAHPLVPPAPGSTGSLGAAARKAALAQRTSTAAATAAAVAAAAVKAAAAPAPPAPPRAAGRGSRKRERDAGAAGESKQLERARCTSQSSSPRGGSSCAGSSTATSWGPACSRAALEALQPQGATAALATSSQALPASGSVPQAATPCSLGCAAPGGGAASGQGAGEACAEGGGAEGSGAHAPGSPASGVRGLVPDALECSAGSERDLIRLLSGSKPTSRPAPPSPPSARQPLRTEAASRPAAQTARATAPEPPTPHTPAAPAPRASPAATPTTRPTVLRKRLERLHAEMVAQRVHSSYSDALLSDELQRRLEMEHEARTQLGASMVETRQLVEQLETVLAANEALGCEAGARSEQIAHLEGIIARMWYQLKTTSGSVLGAAGMCSALGGTTTLLASLDLASPPAAHTRGAHGHDPFLAVGLDAKALRLLQTLGLEHHGSTPSSLQAMLMSLEEVQGKLAQSGDEAGWIVEQLVARDGLLAALRAQLARAELSRDEAQAELQLMQRRLSDAPHHKSHRMRGPPQHRSTEDLLALGHAMCSPTKLSLSYGSARGPRSPLQRLALRGPASPCGRARRGSRGTWEKRFLWARCGMPRGSRTSVAGPMALLIAAARRSSVLGPARLRASREALLARAPFRVGARSSSSLLGVVLARARVAE